MKLMKKMICQRCGKEFVRTGNAQRYCEDCKTAKPPKEKMQCPVCGSIFERNRPNQYYCSVKCRKQNSKKAFYHCEYCGKVYEQAYTSKYCSEECKNKARAHTKKRGRPKKKLTLAEIDRLAKAEGLTYGQYVSKYGG